MKYKGGDAVYEKLKADVAFMNGEYERAASLFLEGAKDGDMLAAYNYAYCLFNGYGVQKDMKAAKSYFSFARDIDGGEACYCLAVMYLMGMGVNKDYKRAISYMEASADKGCIEAQLYMGMAHTIGVAFAPDIIGISMIPYHKPIYRTEDIYALSGHIEESEEEDARYGAVRADARAAFEYFRVAAWHDPTYVSELVSKGKYLYAKCFVDGFGTAHDFTKGSRLMLLAGKEGSMEAIAFLNENGVTPAMLEASVKKKTHR